MVAGCGGGGGGDDDEVTPPAATTLNWSPAAYKAFLFTWTDVFGAQLREDSRNNYQLLQDISGASGYTPVATLSAKTTSYRLENVPLLARLNARYIMRACKRNACVDSAPVSVEGTLAAAVAYVKASNPEFGDNFGYRVALSADGSTLAVGAYNESSNANTINGDAANNSNYASGAVYVFARSNGTWSQQAYIKASNSQGNDQFGCSVSLSGDGNTLVVGAMGEDSNGTGVNNASQADNSAGESGAAYVFVRSGSTWTQQAYVKAADTAIGDAFGWSVAVSGDGNTVAVGAQYQNSTGAVYVFSRSGTAWGQQAYITGSNTELYDGFGYSVALSSDGNTLAISAPYEDSTGAPVGGAYDPDDNGASNTGALYVFTRSNVTWSQQALLKASTTYYNEQFGYSMALSADGNTLVGGTPYENTYAVDISTSTGNDFAMDSGAAYVFARNGSVWSQQAFVKASNTDAGDRFGESVALSADGNTLAVGAIWEDSSAAGINGSPSADTATNSGAAYVYVRSGETWSTSAYVKASNTAGTDQYGTSIALSGDGGTLAVGAQFEDGNAAGVGGDQSNNAASGSGAVYLY